MDLETGRLTVRPFCPADEAALHEILSDPDVMRLIQPPFTPEQTRDFLRQAGLCVPPLVYALARRETGALIGHLIWHPWDAGGYELGWVLRRDCWGLGLASELTEALIAHARRAGISGVWLECAPEQAASRRIAAKFGFHFEGVSGGLEVYRLAV